MEESLLKWINTFEVTNHCTSLKSLADGVTLFELLSEAVPKYFNVSTLKRDVEDNWILQVNNIKKIASNLDAFYQNELGIHDEVHVDASLIAKEKDKNEIIKLVKLILGVIVECENKVTYIGKIMSLDVNAQQELMILIEEIIGSHQLQMSTEKEIMGEDNDAFFSEGQRAQDEEIASLKEQITDLNQTIDNQKSEHKTLKQNYDELKRDNSTIMSNNAELTEERDSLSSSVKRLQEQLETTRNAYKDSSSRQASASTKEAESMSLLASQIEERDRSISEYKRKIEDLMKQANEVRSLRDELDIMRERVQKAEASEEKLKKLSKKAEEVVDLKKQIKALETQNDQYLKQALDAEDTASKANTYKTQTETYKQQLASVKAELTQQQIIISSSSSDLEALRKDNSKLKTEREALSASVRSLEDKLADLSAQREDEAMNAQANTMGSVFGEESVVPAVKEKLARLERENKRLKEDVATNGSSKVEELNTKVEDAERMVTILQQQLDSGGRGDGSGAANPALQAERDSLKNKVQELQEEVNVLLKEKQNGTGSPELLEKLKEAAEKCATLSSDKARLEGYLRTAKGMIKTLRDGKKELEVKVSEGQDAEVLAKQFEETLQGFKNQIKEKEKEVEMIKKLWEEGRESSLREQKLMISAFYDVGLELQRQKKQTGENTAGGGSPAVTKTFISGLRKDRD